ncbi:hypothetical protein ACRE_017920 [Hapsidospora chrysogenum ATCC 11550]|uniref:Uncharacterized protein n=1 Tax=Hapsidospora chrysogenum (strain ATCC 11550 / CBS 779.69 / DSM 880 / IAM 14645 / JCM 23072 / IMI 49137) TaxID=857340 RepID=A0A086TDF5_HAPC1|nr:hypothetical protein ACRE_017920 [Hapsidospora chrysogenum ATCC 11550]
MSSAPRGKGTGRGPRTRGRARQEQMARLEEDMNRAEQGNSRRQEEENARRQEEENRLQQERAGLEEDRARFQAEQARAQEAQARREVDEPTHVADHRGQVPDPLRQEVEPELARITQQLYRFVIRLILAYFALSLLLAPFLPLDNRDPAKQVKSPAPKKAESARPKVLGKFNYLAAEKTAPREPLGIFDDYTALYRAWDSFSAAQPTLPRYRDIVRDVRRIVPIFSEIYALGDTWNRVTGDFTNSTETDNVFWDNYEGRLQRRDRSNDTHVDLAYLESSIIDGMGSAGLTLEHAGPGFRGSHGWSGAIRARLRLLSDGARQDKDVFADPTGIDHCGSGKGKDCSILPAHPDSMKPLTQLRVAAGMDEFAHSVEEFGQSTARFSPGSALAKVLEDLETLQSAAAHASAHHVVAARKHEDWVQFPLLQRISMRWHSTSPLLRAVQAATGVTIVAGQRAKITRLADEVNGLVHGIGEIVACKTALDRQLRTLLSAHGRAGEATGEYAYLLGAQGWLTTRPKDFVARSSPIDGSPRGLPECAPLRGASLATDHGDEHGGDVEEEPVLLYVPSVHYLYSLYSREYTRVSNLHDRRMEELHMGIL